jgi:hypothetical protein
MSGLHSQAPSLETGLPAWLRDVPAIDVIGFSLTGYADAASFGKLLEQGLRAQGWRGEVRDISYGGLSVNALAGLIPLAASPVQTQDIVALELATSFFALHGYSLDQARPLVFAVARHFADRATRVFFLNLFRPDLDDSDCVVQAIREASREFGIPILDLKSSFRARLTAAPFGTVDGIHPDAASRQTIADAMANFLVARPCPIAHQASAAGPEYAYVDLVPHLPVLARYDYEGRGKGIRAAVAPAGFQAELRLEQVEHVVGYCFLYGPETGFIEVTVGDTAMQELITFDENSYYRRIGFRPLDAKGDTVSIRVPAKTRAIELVRTSNLPTNGRSEYVCGLIVRRPPACPSREPR